MNVSLLIKHFPQLQELPPERQRSLLQQAHDRAYSPDRKLQHWRRNLVSLVWVTAVTLFLALVAGPALGVSKALTGTLIMVLVLPGFMVYRHMQYVAELRPEVEKLLARES